MKILFKMLTAAALTTAASSCSSFLDINSNPNQALTVAPSAILATALSTTAANYTGNNPSFNSYASWVASYWGKTGVVSGYGEELTYNYSSSYYAGLFGNTYDNLNDYNIIQTQGAANGYPYHAAIARIMKVYNYQLLVDEYGDIPYTQALQGGTNVAPVYDKAADIYKDLLVQLAGAIDDINKTDATATATFTPLAVGSEDIVFGGDMKKWKKFANSLKLRILLRESQTSDAALTTSVTQQMAALQTAADGFITADVVAQPGYAQSAGQQNPLYNRYAYTAAGTSATERQYQIPTQYILNQYISNNDPRLTQLYTIGARTVGTDANAVTTPEYIGAMPGQSNAPTFVAPIVASRLRGANAATATGGILKGLVAPTALMLLSEHLFSKAEAETRNLFTGGDVSAKQDYLDGIKASFIYFYRAAATTNATINASTLEASTMAGAAGIDQYNTYVNAATNATNPLVSFDNAVVNGALGKQNIIIYQKYLALNSVASTEAWDDYRRTAQPKLPASSQSQSPRADKLPTRLIYPLGEVSTNAANLPTGTTQYTKIFWDVVD
ncbi:SusD/RagB family nutrient-binding outer membrane lipoprotein [Hymenobacter coccineus]|uniref:SusD/RagB family nutrient-binding outer membrane lipoprotein n=1 Tax=Hymenobacter coccineus TaxID=1908235 RepID=A0A1G1TK09_9BACT|nr:SusD/RagB family nutrient-binding outer membrane lipoprotein [Hymenobacter coccineus]OGX91210.1 hypothetical protein BEN49_05195 [Hymenobacter coccineus]